jgi:3-methyl-2-oxobutanoate hydroxymethyltransferase
LTPPAPPAKVTALTFRQRKAAGEKIAIVTAYDVAFARLADRAGVDAVLVGDTLGMVVQGQTSTLPVTLEDIIYHGRAVSRGLTRAHLILDLPFLSYQVSLEDGLRSAGRLMKEGGGHSVKLEGGEEVAELVARIAAMGVPVMGHVGMTPQSVHQFGGFKIQGRTDAQRAKIVAGAKALAQAGAYAIVLETMPAALAAEIRRSASAPAPPATARCW